MWKNLTLDLIFKWLGAISASVAILGGLFKTVQWLWKQKYRARHSTHTLQKDLSKDIYTKEIIQDALRYYIEPDCQDLDPSGAEEPRSLYPVRQKLFKVVDDILAQPARYRYTFLLADSGMGKTAFMINYYARHRRNQKQGWELILFPLGIPKVDQRISAIKVPENKILFLDAFDEDTQAIENHVKRLKKMIDLSKDFRQVLITCRTQFFPKDEEIPKETGILRIGPRRAGEKRDYQFHKLYLSPFTDAQVEQYLKRHYSFRQSGKRKKAQALIEKIPNLIIRPMLLAHIDDLLDSGRKFENAFELYEEMVKAWLIREEESVKGLKKESLRKFSELLAVDLWKNRQERGAERASPEEIEALARTWGIPLKGWQLTGRSLLNRDAEGNYKFAHRSIMEFLVVKCFIDGDGNCRGLKWSDQMQKFFWEVLQKYLREGKSLPFYFSEVYNKEEWSELLKHFWEKRYREGEKRKREQGRKLLEMIPDIGVKLVTLGYLDALFDSERSFKNIFEIYEMLLVHWVAREAEKRSVKRAVFHKFVEQLALKSYRNRSFQNGESIPETEVAQLTERCDIPLKDWFSSSESLFVSVPDNGFRFIDFAMTELLVIRYFTAKDEYALSFVEDVQIQKVLRENLQHYIHKGNEPPFRVPEDIDWRPYQIQLRHEPIRVLDTDAIEQMEKHGFYDRNFNKKGRGISHIYQPLEKSGAKVVFDHRTGLMWQQSGSSNYMGYEVTGKYIESLNKKAFAGYSDWRLPTLEEAMSLMEPDKKNEGLYIAPIFDKGQHWIWTADLDSASRAWHVNFDIGNCYYDGMDSKLYVRAVRSGQA